ncbi:hypothetical protein DSO57_1034986 [Entomophthora muscae]|uniref:Uncharacterized protein n=1 Tax=Entomophthora muscae TaxID=34485 RepID=A0ACC2REH2_9FUNG|nr:hypothetical protein DSO57_1034986 [Entomophthora muscae]
MPDWAPAGPDLPEKVLYAAFWISPSLNPGAGQQTGGKGVRQPRWPFFLPAKVSSNMGHPAANVKVWGVSPKSEMPLVPGTPPGIPYLKFLPYLARQQYHPPVD